MSETITIKTKTADIEANVIKRIKCFAIHNTSFDYGFADDRFTLTHIPTGYAAGDFNHIETCEEMAAKLLALEFDWNNFTDPKNIPQEIKLEGGKIRKTCKYLDWERDDL